MPSRIARERIEAKYFNLTRGKNRAVLQDYIDKTTAFELGGPYLLARGAIQRNDRSFDSCSAAQKSLKWEAGECMVGWELSGRVPSIT